MKRGLQRVTNWNVVNKLHREERKGEEERKECGNKEITDELKQVRLKDMRIGRQEEIYKQRTGHRVGCTK
jgi:hypothetical protein